MSIKVKSPAAPAPLLKNAATAPFIYFDNVPVYGMLSGNIEIDLAARVLLPKPDGSVAVDMVCAAHLRCSRQVAMVLLDALSKALDMRSKAEESERSELLVN